MQKKVPGLISDLSSKEIVVVVGREKDCTKSLGEGCFPSLDPSSSKGLHCGRNHLLEVASSSILVDQLQILEITEPSPSTQLLLSLCGV